MKRLRLGATTAMAFAVIVALSDTASAQTQERCKVLCVPELLVEPAWTIENLAHRPRVIDGAGNEPHRLPRERVFELVLAVDVPTRWRRIGFTAESIFAPASDDNEIELELELNIGVIQSEQTRGWLSSHFDIVDQFGPAERPNKRAYAHRLDFELDTAIAVFKKAPSAFLRSLEVEGSLDYLASGLPRKGDVIDGRQYLDSASRWSFSFVLVIPVAPR
jgi:hypothetical protein